jgi:hypothetical protein
MHRAQWRAARCADYLPLGGRNKVVLDLPSQEEIMSRVVAGKFKL